MDIEDIEKEFENSRKFQDQFNHELIVIYRKGSDMSYPISKMFESRNMRNKLINRQFIVDTLGQYNIIYSDVTNIEGIIDQLSRDCMGYIINKVDHTTHIQ